MVAGLRLLPAGVYTAALCRGVGNAGLFEAAVRATGVPVRIAILRAHDRAVGAQAAHEALSSGGYARGWAVGVGTRVRTGVNREGDASGAAAPRSTLAVAIDRALASGRLRQVSARRALLSAGGSALGHVFGAGRDGAGAGASLASGKQRDPADQGEREHDTTRHKDQESTLRVRCNAARWALCGRQMRLRWGARGQNSAEACRSHLTVQKTDRPRLEGCPSMSGRAGLQAMKPGLPCWVGHWGSQSPVISRAWTCSPHSLEGRLSIVAPPTFYA